MSKDSWIVNTQTFFPVFSFIPMRFIFKTSLPIRGAFTHTRYLRYQRGLRSFGVLPCYQTVGPGIVVYRFSNSSDSRDKHGVAEVFT